MPEPDKNKPFQFANGDMITYDSTKSMDLLMEHFPKILMKRGKGETYNAKRGASVGVRALIGGDNPQAQVATLTDKYGYVQPILYTEDPKETGPQWVADALAGVDSPEMVDDPRYNYKAKPKPGPGKTTKVEFLVYDKKENEYFRVNVPGLDWGDVAGMARGTAETLGDVIPSMAVSKRGRGRPPGAASAMIGSAEQAGASGIGGMMGRGMFDMAANTAGRRDPRPAREQLDELAGTGLLHGAFSGAGEGAMHGLSGAGRALTGAASPKKLAARKSAFREMDEIAPGEYFTPSGLLAGALEKSRTEWGGGFTRSLEGVLYKSAWGNTRLGNKFRRINLAIDKYITKNLDLATGKKPRKTTAIGKSMMEDIGGVSAFVEGGRKSRSAKTGGHYGSQEIKSAMLYENINQAKKGITLFPDQVDKYLGQWARDLRTSSTAHADEVIIGHRGLMTDIDNLLVRKKPIKYEEIDHLRRRVGSYLAEAKFSKNAAADLYKNLYGELKELQLSHLGPALRKQLNKADSFHSAWMDEWQNLLGKVADAANSNQPWKMLQTLIRTGDDVTLSKIFNALDDKTVKQIRQRYIYEMGRKNDLTGFSEHRFVTNFHSQMKDSTKDLLLPPGTAMQKNLDKLVEVIEHRLQQYPQKVNPLFTAATMGGGAGIGGAAGYSQGGENKTLGDFFKGAILGAFVSIGGQVQIARLLSDPKFVKWMAVGLSDTPTSMLKNMDELAAIAASAEDVETKYAIGTYVTHLASEINRRHEMMKVQEKSMKSLGIEAQGAERIDPNMLKIRGE
jgi:hypothetical protein